MSVSRRAGRERISSMHESFIQAHVASLEAIPLSAFQVSGLPPAAIQAARVALITRAREGEAISASRSASGWNICLSEQGPDVDPRRQPAGRTAYYYWSHQVSQTGADDHDPTQA